MQTEKQSTLMSEYTKSLEYANTLTKDERKIFIAGMHMSNVFTDLQNSLTLQQSYDWCVMWGMEDNPVVKEMGEQLKKKEELKSKPWYKRIWC